MSRNRAIAAVQRITTKGGFSQDMTLTPRDGGDAITIQGIASRHFLEVTDDGANAISTNAHVLLSELALVEAGVTVRANDEIDLQGYKIAWTDATGTTRNYIIDDVSPSETVALLVCKLTRYGSN